MPRTLTNQANQSAIGAANPVKAEDSAHTSGDAGYFILAVRSDAATALAAAGDYIPIMVDAYGRLWTVDPWRSVVEADETADDSDKSFTVPASTEAIAMSVRVELTTTATVGNRQITLLFTTGAGVTLLAIKAGTTQAASLTRYYNFAIGLPDLLGFRDTSSLMTPLPSLKLVAGYILRVYDSAAVDATHDDMLVRIMWDRRSV